MALQIRIIFFHSVYGDAVRMVIFARDFISVRFVAGAGNQNIANIDFVVSHSHTTLALFLFAR